jgi:CelD/BcsL family acetyltransferase involved in cellulose biosynthesis
VTISIHARIEELAGDWDRLADAQGAPPWLRPGWFTVYGRAFGVGAWRIHAVRRDGRLAGVVPLVRGRFGLVSPSNWHTPEFAPLAEPDARAELARSVIDAGSSSVALSFVDRSDEALSAWEATAARSGYRLLARPLERSPYVDLAIGWEAYEATLGRKLRSELRRRTRRLADEGEVTFEFCEGGARLAELLDEGFRVEGSGWKGERGSSIDSQASTSAFYRELAEWAAARGWLRVALLRVGGRAIAFDFALEDARVHALLKTGFDPEFGRWAPGMLLRYEMLKRAFASDVGRYDFLGADEPWKLEWTRATRERSLVQAFAPSVAGRAGWAAYARGRPLAKRVVEAVRR